jgi:uncharacterized membrane-anchored protein
MSGITTVITTQSISEKLQDQNARGSEHRQEATTVVVQQKADEFVKSVSKVSQSNQTNKVHKKETEQDKQQKKRDGKRGSEPHGNLDLRA